MCHPGARPPQKSSTYPKRLPPSYVQARRPQFTSAAGPTARGKCQGGRWKGCEGRQQPPPQPGGRANGVDAEEDDVDGDENDMEEVGVGNDGGWAKWVVMGVLVAGMAGAARVLVVRRRKSPGKAL